MNVKQITFVALLVAVSQGSIAHGQQLTSEIPYVENGHPRQVLDIYTPEKPAGDSPPVMFWIHGGGWQVGDKSGVALQVLTQRGPATEEFYQFLDKHDGRE